jgi:hypothetical protein
VLHWVTMQPGARIHQAVQVRQDAYGGLGLFVRSEMASTSAPSAANAAAEDVQGIPAGTELFAVPRTCMVESPQGLAPCQHFCALALVLLREAKAG